MKSIDILNDPIVQARAEQLKNKEDLTEMELAEAKVIAELAGDFFGEIVDSILTDEAREYFRLVESEMEGDRK